MSSALRSERRAVSPRSPSLRGCAAAGRAGAAAAGFKGSAAAAAAGRRHHAAGARNAGLLPGAALPAAARDARRSATPAPAAAGQRSGEARSGRYRAAVPRRRPELPASRRAVPRCRSCRVLCFARRCAASVGPRCPGFPWCLLYACFCK